MSRSRIRTCHYVPADPHNWTLNSCFSVFRNICVHLGPFRYCTKLGAKWAELLQLMQNFMFWSIWDHFVCALNSMQMGQSGAINAKDRAASLRQIFSQRTHPIHHGTQNSSFVAFRNVWVHLGPFCYCTKLDANGPIYYNWCKSSCQEVAFVLVTTNPPDPHNWTLNWCFSVFRNICVHLGPFRYCTKLGAKWAELLQLMQKFMPRSRVGTFRCERTRNTPWDPKLMFCCIS